MYLPRRTTFLDADEHNYSKLMKTTLKMGHFWLQKMIIFCQILMHETVSSPWILLKRGVFHVVGTGDSDCEFGEDCSDIKGDMNVWMSILGLFEKWLYHYWQKLISPCYLHVTVFIQMDADALTDAHPFIIELLAHKIGEIDDFCNKNACNFILLTLSAQNKYSIYCFTGFTA